MLRLVYNILFPIGFVFSAPFYFIKMWRRKNWQKGFGQRFGFYDPSLAKNDCRTIWFHAVSVGEAGICAELVRAVEPQLKGCRIVVSTTTTTGMAELERKLPHLTKFYYPVDLFWGVRNAFRVINPSVVILLEAELWPNFLWQAKDRGTPVFLVNARISDKSFNRYKQAGMLFRAMFSGFAGVGCQNATDAQKLRELGFPAEAIRTYGNMKFDTAGPDRRDPIDAGCFLKQLGVPEESLVLVAGSTHDGEEVLLAQMAERLRKRFPNLFLVLVPRHYERGGAIAKELSKLNTRFAQRSKLTVDSKFEPGALDCLLVDSTGELKAFYKQATVVFIGKSLTAEGGQNPIEPAALGKPVVMGPNMQNFRAIMAELMRNSAAVQVKNEAELETAISELLGDAAKRNELGARAAKTVQSNLGAIRKTADFLLENIEKLSKAS